MEKKILVLLFIPIILGIIGFSFFINEQQKVIISEDNIIEQKNNQQVIIDNFKSEDELLLEIEERYNEIDLQKGIYNPPNRQWQTSGPFSIDRHEYILGEKIFMIAEGIPFDQKGQIVFLRALNSTTYQVWKSFDYDGSMKSAFNIYFEPVLDENLEICFKEDLIGEWVIKFRNTDYENLSFSILDAILPGDEDKFDINKCQ